MEYAREAFVTTQAVLTTRTPHAFVTTQAMFTACKPYSRPLPAYEPHAFFTTAAMLTLLSKLIPIACAIAL